MHAFALGVNDAVIDLLNVDNESAAIADSIKDGVSLNVAGAVLRGRHIAWQRRCQQEVWLCANGQSRFSSSLQVWVLTKGRACWRLF